jgi:hypothetical protein
MRKEKVVFFVVLFIILISGCLPESEPKKYENRITYVENNENLIVSIRTEKDPNEYRLYELYLIGAEKDQILNSNKVKTYVENNFFCLLINKSVLKIKKYKIKVMLYDQGGQLEFYVR